MRCGVCGLFWGCCLPVLGLVFSQLVPRYIRFLMVWVPCWVGVLTFEVLLTAGSPGSGGLI